MFQVSLPKSTSTGPTRPGAAELVSASLTLQRTSVLLNELTRLFPTDSGINEVVDEISADIRFAMHYHYEAGFANGFRLGSGMQNTAAKPRVG